MRTFRTLIFLLSFLCTAASARTINQHASLHRRQPYPFNQLIAFGDELSDNGNGSYSAGITGTPANVYGFRTWTDGPVAVQYLADLLSVPLTDYAFGGCCGGGSFGATINNAYTPAAAKLQNGKPVPSVHDQIYGNYTRSKPAGIGNSLQFIWVGQNDLSEHTDAFWEGDPKNAAFAANISSRITRNAEFLIEQGAPYVFVANIYPKHRAPVTTKYLCQDGGCVETWGNVIETANAAIEASLSKSKYSKRFIYYDVFGYMTKLMDDKNSYGLTEALTSYCDGDATDPNEKWDTCIAGPPVWKGAETFYWMNFIQPTTHVHQLIALDMKAAIDKFFGA